MQELLICVGNHPVAALFLFEFGLFCSWLGVKSYELVKRAVRRRAA